MPVRSTETANGIITVAQEGRFLLAEAGGGMRLMVLSPSAGLEPQDLPALVERACVVEVRHRPSAGRRASVAQRITEL